MSWSEVNAGAKATNTWYGHPGQLSLATTTATSPAITCATTCHRGRSRFSSSRAILVVHPGYNWDGCSGPTWDTAGNMGPGLVHDCLYQAMRMRFVRERAPGSRTWAVWRVSADDDFRDLLESQGWGTSNHKTRIGRFLVRIGGGFRKTYYHKAVRWFGKSSAKTRVPVGWTHQVPGKKGEDRTKG